MVVQTRQLKKLGSGYYFSARLAEMLEHFVGGFFMKQLQYYSRLCPVA